MAYKILPELTPACLSNLIAGHSPHHPATLVILVLK